MSSTDEESIASNESDLFLEHFEGEVESNHSEDETNHEKGGVLPFMFEPLCTIGSSSEEEEEEYKDANENEIENERIGNTSYCLCGECRCMESREESVCCKEIDAIPDEFF